MNTSQTELLQSAQKATAQKDYQGAVAFLQEAQTFGPNQQLTLELITNYLYLDQNKQALDELPELNIYQNSRSFETYLKVLYQNHLIIPFFQIPFYLKQATKLNQQYYDLYNDYQEKFKRLKLPKNAQKIKTQFMTDMATGLIKSRDSYEKLKQLPVADFTQVARTAFLAPGLRPELKVALVEDLVKLGESNTFPIFVLDKLTEVNFAQASLYFDTEFIKISVRLIQSEVTDLSVQQLATSQYMLLLAKLYPRFDLFIENISEFTFSFLRYFGILGDEDFDKNDNPYFALIEKLNQSEEF
ncbi:hypothetical protein R4Y45_03840 [Holzapfeliella sp. He02]|uniref:TPR repeat-containing protein n=1 Tax=Holzapfeliella saturejae TaxID=3082953 RepID=A0ABU8SG47_9LACO